MSNHTDTTTPTTDHPTPDPQNPHPGDPFTLRTFFQGGPTFEHVVVIHVDETRVVYARDHNDPGRTLLRADFEVAARPQTIPETFWVELHEFDVDRWGVDRHEITGARGEDGYAPHSRRPNCRWVRVYVVEALPDPRTPSWINEAEAAAELPHPDDDTLDPDFDGDPDLAADLAAEPVQ